MRFSLHCLDCGFRLWITVSAPEEAEALAGSLSCGHCGGRRWTTSPAPV